jgi:hypothetical protein
MYGCYPFVNLANSRLQLTWDLAGHSFAEFVGSVYYFVRFVKYFSCCSFCQITCIHVLALCCDVHHNFCVKTTFGWSLVIFVLLYLCYFYLFTYTGVQHDFHFRRCSCRFIVTRRVSLMEQELLTHPEYLSFSEVRAGRSLILCIVLSVLLLTVSDNTFDIFKLFLAYLYKRPLMWYTNFIHNSHPTTDFLYTHHRLLKCRL